MGVFSSLFLCVSFVGCNITLGFIAGISRSYGCWGSGDILSFFVFISFSSFRPFFLFSFLFSSALSSTILFLVHFYVFLEPGIDDVHALHLVR